MLEQTRYERSISARVLAAQEETIANFQFDAAQQSRGEHAMHRTETNELREQIRALKHQVASARAEIEQAKKDQQKTRIQFAEEKKNLEDSVRALVHQESNLFGIIDRQAIAIDERNKRLKTLTAQLAGLNKATVEQDGSYENASRAYAVTFANFGNSDRQTPVELGGSRSETNISNSGRGAFPKVASETFSTNVAPAVPSQVETPDDDPLQHLIFYDGPDDSAHALALFDGQAFL